MYLKSIEIQGFKSFANKILFEFHNGITGIVGPNGSGKSNVADAVRWVLGEQRAKQLRGGSMQDVIFAGTELRKPQGFAYVAITLDNSDHQLAIDYDEVTVSRRLYRSGESEYKINGSTCRLKDISELFYDTGIGKEGYSIIGQGQIDKILSGKPEERRELFDEAAGIVKFKRRKAIAQKKLEDEKQKQDLEYKMLQSQINPHFLYNTLNSIKWMATIQGATGISEMTTSLSRLLKSISKGTSLLIDIREELSLLENYFTIQSYRYGGTITMDIQVDNESLYNSEIIKFTLQPLVENAIFHGIEPKGCAGHIRIHVGYETSDNTEKSRIDVTDDGVGMTADKAAQVLRSNDDSSADFFREIGVSNVHKRLQYQFGDGRYASVGESVA